MVGSTNSTRRSGILDRPSALSSQAKDILDTMKKVEITGLDAANTVENVKVFHAGTKLEGNRVLTDGGRVLGVMAAGRFSISSQAQPPTPPFKKCDGQRMVPKRHQRQPLQS
ncbi:MAG: phosphoribosylglycinamide synthetase C domain-containing protein [Nocardioidaceae bacterium]